MKDQSFCATAHDATYPQSILIGHVQVDGALDLPARAERSSYIPVGGSHWGVD